MSSSTYTVAALAKGLRVLSVFSERDKQMRLVDVANATGLPVPTVYRLLKTLEAEGYLDQLPDGTFRPSVRVLALGYAALQASDVVEAATSPLQRLADATGETVNLGVLVVTSVLYLARVRNTELVTADIQVGSTLPAACTSIGKVLLANLGEDELKGRLHELDFTPCRGPAAPSSTSALRRELAAVRVQGWAQQNEEVAHGLRSIAAPVCNDRAEVIAAINLAVPAARWSADDLVTKFLQPLKRTAADISMTLGFFESPQGAPASG